LFAQELAVVQSLLATAPELGRPYHESSIPSLRRLLHELGLSEHRSEVIETRSLRKLLWPQGGAHQRGGCRRVWSMGEDFNAEKPRTLRAAEKGSLIKHSLCPWVLSESPC